MRGSFDEELNQALQRHNVARGSLRGRMRGSVPPGLVSIAAKDADDVDGAGFGIEVQASFGANDTDTNLSGICGAHAFCAAASGAELHNGGVDFCGYTPRGHREKIAFSNDRPGEGPIHSPWSCCMYVRVLRT